MHPTRLMAAAAALASLALAAPAGAATDATQIQLLGGSLDFGTTFSAANFPATQLNGLPQTVQTSVGDWSVNDSRGTLLGWNVKIAASRFTDDNGTGGDTSDDKTLPLGSLSLTAPSVSAGAGQSALLAPVVQPLTTALDNGTVDVPLAIGAALKGQGLWNFTQGATHLSLVIPPTAETGTYTSTITTTLSSGPV